MNLKQASSLIPALIEAGVSVEMQSSPGVGKSETVEQIVDALSVRDSEPWGLAKCFLATMTPSDLMGYMMPETRTYDGQDVRVSAFTMPPWMLTTEGKPVTAYRRGILFLDEYGQGEADTKRASAELLLNHRLGQWALPKGWGVVAASNRSSDRSGVTKSFDFIINRRALINVEADLNSWIEWANKHDVLALTIAFAAQNPAIVFTNKVPDKQEPWCTPRSLVMADRVIRQLSLGGKDALNSPETNELVSGIIGHAAAGQFFAFVRLEQEMPKFDDIVANPSKVKVPTAPDAQMLIAYSLAHRVDDKSVDPVTTYIDRFPKEFGVTFVKAATKRNYKLITMPSFRKWCSDNSALMAAMNN